MTREFYKAVLDMFMCADPWPLSKKEHSDMLYYLNQKARDFGYNDWLEAYHSKS
jgi:hypothetical protein